jgi:type II secretory pathway pseudopilin PulG
LVVITIIGILIALLLPAVQAAREAARKTKCANQLKQMALACLNHEHVHGFLPTGGWGYYWSGDPNWGFDRKQPGGWLYNILPYSEQQALHDIGLGDAESLTSSPAKLAADLAKIATTPLGGYICPTRRLPILYPFVHSNGSYNIAVPPMVARADYAGSLGELLGPGTINVFPSSIGQGQQWSKQQWYNVGCWAQGVIYTASMCRLSDIKDGTTNTLLCGEKYHDEDDYATGQNWGDDQTWDLGTDWDVNRPVSPDPLSGCEPLEDTPGVMYCTNFGSAHPVSFNMALCDGSIRAIAYSISLETFRRLGDRADGLTIDGKGF